MSSREAWPRAGAAAVVAGLGLAAGLLCFGAAIRVTSRSADWRAVTEGLRRAPRARGFAGRGRALVHFHDLSGHGERVDLSLSAWDRSVPVRLLVRSEDTVLYDLSVPERPVTVSVPLAEGADEVEILLEATPAVETPHALYEIHEVTLWQRASLARRAAEAMPMLVGLGVLLAVWPRAGAVRAVLWSLLAVAGAAGFSMTLLDPQAALRFRPETREWLRACGLASLWALSLASARPRAAACAGVLGTVGILYLPSLKFGFMNEDFTFARAWPWVDLLSAFHGSWYPERGVIGEYFRPLVPLTFAMDHALWGWRPEGYHLTNLVIHSANGLLAFALLRRLGLPDRGALGGALAWIAHPLAVTAAVWYSERTDGLMAAFYLAALIALCADPLSRPRRMLVVGFGLLALCAKEMAVTLPAVAALVTLIAMTADRRPPRRSALALLALLVVAYVGYWAVIFPEKFLEAHGAPRWKGFDPQRPADWLGAVPALYATVFAPTDYADWWRTSFRERSPLYVTLASVAPLLVYLFIRRADLGGRLRRIALLGLIWPLVTVVPILAIAEVDLYRLGLLICFAFALLWGSLLTVLEQRWRWLPVALAASLAFVLTPGSLRTAAAWGPDGFVLSLLPGFRRHFGNEWWDGLHPEMKRLFDQQVHRRDHAERLLRDER